VSTGLYPGAHAGVHPLPRVDACAHPAGVLVPHLALPWRPQEGRQGEGSEGSQTGKGPTGEARGRVGGQKGEGTVGEKQGRRRAHREG